MKRTGQLATIAVVGTATTFFGLPAANAVTVANGQSLSPRAVQERETDIRIFNVTNNIISAGGPSATKANNEGEGIHIYPRQSHRFAIKWQRDKKLKVEAMIGGKNVIITADDPPPDGPYLTVKTGNPERYTRMIELDEMEVWQANGYILVARRNKHDDGQTTYQLHVFNDRKTPAFIGFCSSKPVQQLDPSGSRKLRELCRELGQPN